MNNLFDIKGKFMATPFKPHGIVFVTRVLVFRDLPSMGRPLAEVTHINEHYGYPAGDVGNYYAEELIDPALLPLEDYDENVRDFVVSITTATYRATPKQSNASEDE